MPDSRWTETTFSGRLRLVGDGRLMIMDLPGDNVSIAGTRGPDGALPGVVVRRADLDALIAVLGEMMEPPPRPEASQ